MTSISIESLQKLKIGWATGGLSLDHPAHRRTLLYYAKARNLSFEIADIHKAYDVVYMSQGADITTWMHYDKGKIVYEFSDAYLAEATKPSLRTVFRGLAKFITRQNHYLRLSYSEALQDMLCRADAVFCGTEEQRKLIAPFNENVHFLIGFHGNDIKSVKKSYFAGQPFNLVWEGLPALLGFKPIIPVLEETKRNRGFALHLITDIKRGQVLNNYFPVHTKDKSDQLFPFGDVYLYEWNQLMFSTIVTTCDLAIIPIPMDRPFWVGKPPNKLLLFWRMGMPTLTSATPAYIREMKKCGLDMICATPQEWEDKLMEYMCNERLRREAGCLARAFVETEYSEEKLLARWDEAFASVL